MYLIHFIFLHSTLSQPIAILLYLKFISFSACKHDKIISVFQSDS